MPQFNLAWFAAPVMVNPNAISQRALYRRKSVGGAFISTGFTPANDLTIVTQAVTSPDLLANVIWEFKVQAICTTGGPVDNNNGLVEGLKFACLTPVTSSTTSTATIQINISNTDITKATFTLHKSSDDSVIFGPTTVNPSGSIIQNVAIGLDDDTEYYWSYHLHALVNGVEINSLAVNQLNSSCESDPFSTLPDVCLPITALTAIAQETA
jgi:hypothetical protein